MRHLVIVVLVALLYSLPGGAAAGSSSVRAFITSSGSPHVFVVDTTTYGSTPLNLGAMTHGVAVDPSGSRVYVTSANGSTPRVFAIDAGSGQVVGSFDLASLVSPGLSPFGVAVSPDGKYLYVTHLWRRYVGALTALKVSESGALSWLGTVNVGGATTGVAVNRQGDRIYVANSAGRITVIVPSLIGSTSGNPVKADFYVGTALTGIAVSPDSSRIYVTDTREGKLWTVDATLAETTSGTLDPTLEVPWVQVGKGPFGVAVSSDGMRLAVANSEDDTVSLINALNLPDQSAVRRAVPVGDGPHGVAFASDNSRVFVVNRYGYSLTVLDFETGKRVRDDIPLGLNTYPVAFGNFLTPGLRSIVVRVDVKPGGNPNVINLKSRGTTPVAILGSTGYDVTQVNIGTVRLAGAPVARKPNGAYMDSFDDVNGDGLIDLVLHFETAQMKLSPGDTQVTLEGEMTDGTPFSGTDSVKVVP